MKKLALITFLLFSSIASAQLSPTDSLFSVINRKNSFLPSPVFGYSQETSLSFGLTAYYTFFYDQLYFETRPSIAYLTSSFTLRKQFTNDVYINAWAPKNKFHYLLAWSFYKYNYSFYGVGNNTSIKDETLLEQVRLEFNGDVERKLGKKFIYGGIEFDLKRDYYTEDALMNVAKYKGTTAVPNTTFLRMGPALIHDNRDNAYYTTKGHYYRVIWSHTIPGLARGIDFQRFFFETRNFFTFKKIHTFGLNTNLQIQNGNIPFYELSQIGNANIMRGYYTGRFRDLNILAGQLEYRWHFTPLFGLVLFVGGGKVFNETLNQDNMKPNYGLGLRYFYNQATGINVRLDYGFGEKFPGEPLMSNFYVTVGESF